MPSVDVVRGVAAHGLPSYAVLVGPDQWNAGIRDTPVLDAVVPAPHGVDASGLLQRDREAEGQARGNPSAHPDVRCDPERLTQRSTQARATRLPRARRRDRAFLGWTRSFDPGHGVGDRRRGVRRCELRHKYVR